MKKFHKLRYQKGFTIVELLIVIVVIGILAALVLNAFSGVQAKARDTQRQTNVRAVASQLEAYFNGTGNGSYPLQATVTSDTSAAAAFSGFDVNALHAPGGTANAYTTVTALTASPVIQTSNSTTAPPTTPAFSNTDYSHYMYIPYNGTAASPTLCTATPCSHFAIYYVSENTPATGTYVAKTSLN